MNAHDDHPVLFYDGACGLCDRSVRWIMRRDRAHRFRFAPLQGETYAALERDDKPHDLSTVVALVDKELFTRSDAALAVGRELGGVWRFLARAASLVPRPLRDACYRLIARHRLRFFGGPEACRLPNADERERLLP
ncbi:MAG: DCC1-like thiol-disulfide oxidoreductase family protein [Planctomycetota bacterium]